MAIFRESVPAKAPAQRELRISNTMSLGRASLMLAAMIGLSRITGFGRMILTSALYGRGPVTDAYNAAFNIPDTITILIAGGALATGFVPVFTDYLAKDQQDAARRTFRAMLTLLGAAFAIITAILFALTYTRFGTLLAPRRITPEHVQLYLELLRILLVAQFFFVLGGLFSGTLNALRLFWYAALQPVVFNLGIIVLGLWRPAVFGTGVEGIKSQAWGALLGAIVGSLVIQMPAIVRNGLSLRPLWDFQDPGVRRVLRSLLPIMFGLASGQIIALNLPRFFAVNLPTGDLTALDNANRLMQVPLAMLASGPAIALFPTIAMLAAQGKSDELRVQVAGTLRRVLLLILLTTALLLALRFALVHFLLEYGRFTKLDSRITAGVLGCYAWCLLGLGAQQLLARGFYAIGNTRGPITTGLAGMGIFGVLGAAVLYVFPGYVPAAPALALAAAAAVSVLALLMGLGLRYKLGGWDDGATIIVLCKGAVAAVAAYFAALWVQRLTGQWMLAHGYDAPQSRLLIKVLARAAIVVLGAGAGTAAFSLVGVVLRIKELDALTARFKKFGAPKTNARSKFFRANR